MKRKWERIRKKYLKKRENDIYVHKDEGIKERENVNSVIYSNSMSSRNKFFDYPKSKALFFVLNSNFMLLFSFLNKSAFLNS